MGSLGVWVFVASAAAAQEGWSPIPDAGPAQGRAQAVTLWTGQEMLVLGGRSSSTTSETQSIRYQPRTQSWSALSTAGTPAGCLGHTAVWTGREAIVWGGLINNLTGITQTGARYDPRTDTWTPTSTSGAPSPRFFHVAVWTGREMIVWGGEGNATLADGARYDPVTDAWSPISNTGAPAARFSAGAVWTGHHMIVWGGLPSNPSGGRYDPVADVWSPLSVAGAPQPRIDHSSVWTGREMVVWGGIDNLGNGIETGGRYDPVTDTWASLSTAGAPSPRRFHSAVWTGRDMIVWGGQPQGLSSPFIDGARYDPLTDVWTILPTSGAPAPRTYHAAAWTGRDMLVFGGLDSTGNAAIDGDSYRPPPSPRDGWSGMSTAGAPEGRSDHVAVWTEREMIVWGGQGSVTNPGNGFRLDSGGRYDVAALAWTSMSSAGAPSARQEAVGLWSGRELIVLGGSAVGGDFGGRYDPQADAWSAINGVGAPPALIDHGAVWTGREAIVWGGSLLSALPTDTGARYDPRTDTWTPVNMTGAPSARYRHSVVWTGREMIVWGGLGAGGTPLGDGARYDPRTDTWSALPAGGAPSARGNHRAVWTGAEMLVWGGGQPATNTGARYSPRSNAWSPMSAVNAPPAPFDIEAVWTGDEMLIWGQDGSAVLGGRYAPEDDAWSAITTSGAPSRRQRHTALWTGRYMAVWGGNDSGPGTGNTNTGGAYGDDPTPPVPGVVIVPIVQVDRMSISAAWSGFSDPESGIAAYAWAIGTTPGDSDLQAFTDVGRATSATAYGLALELGRTYYVAVRAVNAEGRAVTSVSGGLYIGQALEADVDCAAGATRPAIPPWALLALLALARRRTSR